MHQHVQCILFHHDKDGSSWKALKFMFVRFRKLFISAKTTENDKGGQSRFKLKEGKRPRALQSVPRP